VPDEGLASIDAHAGSATQRRNAETAAELIAEFGRSTDELRKNELETALTLSLNGIANRIDKGYDIDERAPQPPPTETDQSDEDPDAGVSPEVSARADAQMKIRELSPHLRLDHRRAAPILELPTP
jgi:hypothetical protein